MSICPWCAGGGLWPRPSSPAVTSGERVALPCTRCGGKGDVCDADPIVCERCDGIGSVYDVAHDALEECPACGGPGTLMCLGLVVERTSAESAWCDEHRPGAPPAFDWNALRGALPSRRGHAT